MANEFIARNGITSLGNIVVSGSLTATGAITVSGSIASASFATNAATASSADNLLVRSTLTAQTLVVQTITSSVDFVTGSTRFGSLSSNTHQFTGSVGITGSLVSTGSITTVASTGNANLIIQTLQASQNTQIQFLNTARTVYIGNQITSTGSMFEVHDASLGTSRLFISASGNVGIGTTNPLSLLDVTVLSSGARRLLVNYDDSIVTIKSANDSAGGETLRLIGDVIIFNTGSTGSGGEAMRLTNTGRVGIGTASPSYKLHVYAPSSASYFDGGTTDTSFYISHGSYLPGQTIGGIRTNSGSPVLNAKSGGTLYFNRDINTANIEFQYNTGSATSLFISGSGRIGIGTSTPSGSRLHVYIGNDGGTGTPGVILATSNGANDIVRFQDGTTTVAVIKNNGYIGVGTSNPLSPLHVGGAIASSGDAAAITLKQTSTTATTGIYLERSGEQKGYYLYIGGSTDNLTFQRNNAGTKSDVMALTRDGVVDLLLGQLKFPATQNASSDPNTLDDYEEGSWTPSFDGAGSPSYSVQFGRYTKIGNMVYCTIALRATSISGSSTISISGLPFAAAQSDDTQQRPAYNPRLGGHINGLSDATAKFRVNSTSMTGVKGDNDTTFMTAAQFCSGGSIQITGNFWYYV